MRTAIARSENVPPYVIFSDVTLVEMATYLPQDEIELRRISGVGDLKLEKYGADFIRATTTYCLKNDLRSRIALKSPKRERKVRTKRDSSGKDTFQISLEMFRAGKSIAQIASERGLSNTTIENHLARFIPDGKVSLDELVAEEKVELIREAIVKFADDTALSPIKEFLGDDYTYGEIRAVIASMGG